MNLYEKSLNREEKAVLVGFGYVGMPIAVAFDKKVDVTGYDPEYSFEDGIKLAIEWYKENL